MVRQSFVYKRIVCTFFALCISMIALISQSTLASEEQPFSSVDLQHEEPYIQQLKIWQQQVQDSTDYDYLIPLKDQKGTISESTDRQGVHLINEDQSFTFTATVPETALYQLTFDALTLSSTALDATFALQVNGDYPFLESRRLMIPSLWENETDEFTLSAAGQQLIPQQRKVSHWMKTVLQTEEAMTTDGFRFLLEAGENTIVLTGVSGEWYIDQVEIHAPKTYEPYQSYLQNQDPQSAEGLDHHGLVIIEAEHTLHRNSSSIRPFHSNSTSVEPYSTKQVLLNAFGGSSWGQSGQRVTWSFHVPETGNYHITLKLNQLDKKNTPVFRKVLLDGVVPFAELLAYRIDPTSDWAHHTLGEGEVDYSFYLTQGEHILTMEATAAPLAESIHRLDILMEEMRNIGLEVKQLTGNQPDAKRDWTLIEYLPGIDVRFTEWQAELSFLYQFIKEVYGEKGSHAQELVQLELVEKKIAQLGKQINDLPNRLADLSEGSNAAVQNLAMIQALLQEQPLAIDLFYIHGEMADIPREKVSFLSDMQRKLSAFFGSFSTGKVQEHHESIEVWVARSQQYVDLMQQMTESVFSHDTGIQVNFSVMPNEQKLILANASGQQPDVALGVSVGTPYELAIRGSAQDLTSFPSFKSFSRSFSPGAFLPMTLEDGIYALPETQDFYVQFVRKDILEQLSLEIPETWTDVTRLLPELQRIGMNYFVPLSGSAGTKPFMFTAPFIYQFGGDLYSEDGLSTAIDQEQSLAGLQFMSELYSLYSLPQQVPNFYHAFRYGTLPIGISNFETYVKLTTAAPELANAWDIALYPGVVEEDGTVNRWTTGSAQSAMMFDQSEHKEEAWTFMQWWLSAETQIQFAQNLQTIYGREFMWNTANLEAFDQLPWPEAHKEVILTQWESLKEVPKTPGAYILEREISNVWTDVVFNGIHLRASVDDRVITINREIRRKLAEFSYMEGNRMVRPYHIPTLEGMEAWFNEE